MRFGHLLSGLAVFGLGLFFTYYYSPLVVGVFKGSLQPIMIIIGMLALLSVVFDKTRYKKINLLVAVVMLAVGGYGWYDEYIATMDFLYGVLPVALVLFGVISVAHGVRTLK